MQISNKFDVGGGGDGGCESWCKNGWGWRHIRFPYLPMLEVSALYYWFQIVSLQGSQGDLLGANVHQQRSLQRLELVEAAWRASPRPSG